MRPHLRFGHFTFAPGEGELHGPDTRQRLQPQVAALLELFLGDPGRLFTHEELLDLLWPDVYVNPEALTQVMSRLRRALGETRARPRHIETLHKRGYRFIGEVTPVARPAPSTSRAPPSSSTFAPAPSGDLTTPSRAFIARRFPTLTLAAHPDLSRVGESVRLTPLTLGEDVLLSRLQPGLRRRRDDPPRPIEDPGVSRAPIVFRRGALTPDGPSLLLEVPDTTAVRVDGAHQSGPLELPPARIAAGVVLELADRVTLVLHESAEPKAPGDELGLLGESYATTALRHELKHLVDHPVHIVVTGEALALGPVADALARLHGLDAPAPRLEPGVHSFPEAAPALVTCHILGGQLARYHDPLAALFSRPTAPTRLALLIADPEPADEALLAALSAYVLTVAPLSQRRADVAPLLLAAIARLAGGPLWSPADAEPWLPSPLMARIVRHTFPQGLAELEAVARHLATLGAAGPVRALPLHLESRLAAG